MSLRPARATQFQVILGCRVLISSPLHKGGLHSRVPEEMIRDWWKGHVSGRLETELIWKTRPTEKSRCVRRGEGGWTGRTLMSGNGSPSAALGASGHHDVHDERHRNNAIRNLGIGEKVLTCKTVSRKSWAEFGQ